MDFDFTVAQSDLKRTISDLLADTYSFEARRKHMSEPEGWSQPLWRKFAKVGLLGLPFAEADGGSGGGAVETMIVMEALGKALVVEPYLETVVVGGGFLRRGGSDAQRAEYIPRIVDGRITFAFAQIEKNSRYSLHDITTVARPRNGGWVIDGEKRVVRFGKNADTLIVTARTKGEGRDETGIGVFLVRSESHGVHQKGYRTQDDRRASDITFTGVEIGGDAAIGDPCNGLPLLERVVDEARAALCSEAVGAMESSLEITVQYLKTRKQFGTVIGAFQSLQHRAAEMFVALEQARSMAMFATMAVDFEDPMERSLAISAAKVQIGKSLLFIGQQSIQLHGAVGITAGAAIGHYFKRMTMIETMFGDTSHHLRRVSDGDGLLA